MFRSFSESIFKESLFARASIRDPSPFTTVLLLVLFIRTTKASNSWMAFLNYPRIFLGSPCGSLSSDTMRTGLIRYSRCSIFFNKSARNKSPSASFIFVHFYVFSEISENQKYLNQRYYYG